MPVVWGPRYALRQQATGVNVGEPERLSSLEPEVTLAREGRPRASG